MMTEQRDVAGVRRAALDRIERNEKRRRALVLGAVGVEVFFLAGFVLLANFADRTHFLLFLATVAIYTIVALGLLALAEHNTRNTQLILKAIELGQQETPDRGGAGRAHS